jgi:2-amino-4-hydroxy-6-hydroxymethyldihydropteridine diphosphokinase
MKAGVMNKIILALGSNTDQEMNMMRVEQYLRDLFTDIAFSTHLWTEPIGIQSDRFINELAFIKTRHGQQQIVRAMKQLEKRCGSTKAERTKNIIRIDVDILQFNDIRLKEDDWNRDYIKLLIKQDPFI